MSAKLKPSSARELRGRSTFTVEIRPGFVFRIRRLTMTDLVLQQLIPLNMLQAALKFNAIMANAEKTVNAAEEAEKVSKESPFTPQVIEETREFLRRYACAVVVEPKIVMEDDGNEDHLPVDELTYDDLSLIFKASPDSEKEAPVTKEQAEDFRRGEPGVSPDVLAPQQGVSKTAVLVDHPDRETIHG